MVRGDDETMVRCVCLCQTCLDKDKDHDCDHEMPVELLTPVYMSRLNEAYQSVIAEGVSSSTAAKPLHPDDQAYVNYIDDLGDKLLGKETTAPKPGEPYYQVGGSSHAQLNLGLKETKDTAAPPGDWEEAYRYWHGRMKEKLDDLYDWLDECHHEVLLAEMEEE